MNVREIRDLLAVEPFFADLDADYLDLVAGCGTNVRFDAGTMIFREGEPADTFYVLRQGKVALEIHVPERGALVIETLGPGELLGWSWLFPPYRWHFDARAIAATAAVALDGACLRGKCDDDTRLGYLLMRRFAEVSQERLQATRLQLLDVYGDAR
jgi:CRP/FNR family transcriptional regulator, cyclic AMP receptor protein